MGTGLDPSLLEPPEPAPARVWLAAGILLLVAGGVTAWLLLRSAGGSDEVLAEPGTGGASLSGPEGVVTPTTLHLVQIGYDAAFILYPTLLPEGYELCRALDDLRAGDRFCSAETTDSWLQVAVRSPEVARIGQGTAIPDAHNAVWLRRGEEPLEIGVPVGPHSALVVTARGIDEESLIAVVQSIPIVADRSLLYAAYEVPLDLAAVSDEELGSLVADLTNAPRVTGRRGSTEANVHAGSTRLMVQLGATLPEFATTVPRPQLVTVAGRLVVLGESVSRGRMWALWDQAGYSWRLEGAGTAQDALSSATGIIRRIGDLG